MKPLLQFSKPSKYYIVVLLLFSLFGFGQTIGIPTVNAAGGPITINFQVTNGSGSSNHFKTTTTYKVYLSDTSGSNFTQILTFTSPTAPFGFNGAIATISRTIPIPLGTPSGSGYKIAIGSTSPTFNGSTGINASNPFILFCAFSMPSTLNGFIKSASPALTFYLLTITNTGNVSDSYNLSNSQTGTNLTVQIQNTSGVAITATPVLSPNQSYTFMIRFDTPNGTQPDNYNYTTILATSNNCPSISYTCLITTYIYGGNGNPNLPNSPDLQIIKTASLSNALVGNFIDYSITIQNNTTKNALNPVIKDFLPANADLISYNKAVGEVRPVLFTYDSTANTLVALMSGNLINSSLPLTINIRVSTNCHSVPSVTNSAEVSTSSGDTNPLNDTSLVTTNVNFDYTNPFIGTWTGLQSTDWFDCRNWSGTVVPDNTIDVTIPIAINYPVINALSPFAPVDQIARCNDLTIQNSRNLTVINQSNLYVAGNWSNNGNFIPGNGTVTFNSSIPNQYQTINDVTNTATFYNLKVDNSNGSKGVSILDNFGLFVTNNLDLMVGDIRLNGKAQLIQTKIGASTNTSSGTGKIQKDQQGQSNKYNYNFWSSPVGVSTYTVYGVLKDGTNPSNPQNINWIGGYDGSPTVPISLASYWIFKYQNLSSNYANWTSVGPNGILNVGQGFTLKGSGASTPTQNYTFEGKPNSGLITNSIAPNNLNLSGNPYPSAIDAHLFIDDNVSSINGALYFWEHSLTNSSHNLSGYQGGYAMLTKTGGIAAIAPIGINGIGTSNKIPQRYVPVGQGFFVFGNSTGGTIKFQNSQRSFKLETDVNSNFMFRQNNLIANENYKKIRLGFTNNTTMIKREILVGFMNQFASTGFDYAYDGEQIDSQNNDMYFYLNGKKLSVQGLGNFSSNTIIQIGINIQTAGNYTISLNNIENFNNQEKIYLYDNVTHTYYNLKDSSISLNLNVGTYHNRFSIRFVSLSGREEIQEGVLETQISRSNNQLSILAVDDIKTIELYNLVGQKVASWAVTTSSKYETLDITTFSDGIYIVKIDFETYSISKKIIK